MTIAINKHLLPVYDKPMVYYPLCTLMQANIRDILIISLPEDICHFKDLLGNGDRLGLRLEYAEQPSPNGLAEAFIIGEEFIGEDDVAMVLGDNILLGLGIEDLLRDAAMNTQRNKATIFGYRVEDPRRFGVIELAEDGKVISIEEKPKEAKSDLACVGLYFYDNRVIEFAKRVRPSWRNELEITDVNNLYLKEGDLQAIPLGRGFAWMDAGTIESMAEATAYVRSIENHENQKVACPEEIALRNGWIGVDEIKDFLTRYPKNEYGKYIANVLEEKSSH
jgi:glucose-1-phosphate thymidylyltransferase